MNVLYFMRLWRCFWCRQGTRSWRSAPGIWVLLGMVTPLALPEVTLGLVLAVGVFILFALAPIRQLAYLGVGLVLGGIASLLASISAPNPACDGEVMMVMGAIDQLPFEVWGWEGETRWSTRLRVEATIPSSCGDLSRVQVSVPQPLNAADLGRRVVALGTFSITGSQWSRGRPPEQANAMAQGLGGRLWAKHLDTLSGDPPWLDGIRGGLAHRIDTAIVPIRVKGLLLALTVGDGSRLPTQDWRKFRALGITHALVISGLHVGLVYGAVWWLGRRLVLSVWPRMLLHRDYSVLLAWGCAGAYAMLAGFTVPTQRALLMLSVLVLVTLAGWRTTPLRALLTAAVMLVAAQPFSVLGPSFWLTVSATGLLLVIHTVLTRCHLFRVRGVFIKAVLGQSMLVFGLMPLVTLWYPPAGVVAIAANLLLVPLLSLTVIPAALIAALATVFASEPILSSRTPIVWQPAQGFSRLWFGLLDETRWHLGAEQEPETALGRALALQVSSGLQKSARRDKTSSKFSLTVLDVGQGLSILVRVDGNTILYDTGDGHEHGFTQADRVILPFLRHQAVSAIDWLILSHGDRDHIGGVDVLLDAMPVAKVYGHGGLSCRPGQEISLGGSARLRFLNGDLSALGVVPSAESDNDVSCVVLIEYLNYRFLLMGDVERSREKALVRFWREELSANVLIAAHHGSNTSSSATFLKWAKPDYAVFSAGRGNRFGHPAATVVDRFAERNTTMLNTAVDGAITFTIEGSALTIATMRDGTIPYWLRVP
jgi:competence protein ComEC